MTTHIKKKHRIAIESLCISMNLVDATTETMHNNGSIRLWDPVSQVYYSLHESGYIRRWIPTRSAWYAKTTYKAYQLNLRNDSYNWGSPISIPMGMDEQIVTLINAIPKYRKTISERPF